MRQPALEAECEKKVPDADYAYSNSAIDSGELMPYFRNLLIYLHMPTVRTKEKRPLLRRKVTF